MKDDTLPLTRSRTRQGRWWITGLGRSNFDADKSDILLGLMAPMMIIWLNLFMFRVSVPAIRDGFGLQADVAAWLVTIYTLPFMILMPLYGRLGDALGKRRLFLIGIVIFLSGTIITALAPTLGWLIAGRAIQGIGSSGGIPLSIAIISQRFLPNERGQAMGIWNSIGPITGIIGPFLSGLLVDYLGWRTIFGPVVLIGLIGYWVVKKKVPVSPGYARPNFWRTFDWTGVVLLGSTLTALLFYTSSRSITGVAALQDWRLLLLTVLSFGAFIYWEKRQKAPFVVLSIFKRRTFTLASICAGIRMAGMSSISFLLPLYLTDVHARSAAAVGVMLTIYSIALLVIMSSGGQLADKWGSRWPVVIGLTVQAGGMAYFVLLPATAGWLLILMGVVVQGLGAGLSVAALHRAAMVNIPAAQTGMAAGVYSMIRYTGTVFGVALAGVILHYGFSQQYTPIDAYRPVFIFIACVSLLGVLVGAGLRE